MLNILVYIILVVLGVVFAFLYPTYELMLFVGVPILYPILSFLINIIAVSFLKITVTGENKQIYKDEECRVKVQVENRSILPLTNCTLRYTYRYEMDSKQVKGKIKFSIKGKGKCNFTLQLKGSYSGAVVLRIKRIDVKDSFKVFTFPKRINKEYKQYIYPKLCPITMDITETVSFYNDEYEEFYEDHPGNDPSEVFEIREYREGDRLSRIHWKASSKKDRYMVKEYSDPIIITAVVVFDNVCKVSGKERLEQWSALLEKTIQASYTLMQKGINHYVYWFDGDDTKGERREIKNEKDFAAVIPCILRSRPNKDNTGYCNYLLYSEQVERYPNVFYIGEENREMLEQSGIDIKVVE